MKYISVVSTPVALPLPKHSVVEIEKNTFSALPKSMMDVVCDTSRIISKASYFFIDVITSNSVCVQCVYRYGSVDLHLFL